VTDTIGVAMLGYAFMAVRAYELVYAALGAE
jgi:hypothetical protein